MGRSDKPSTLSHRWNYKTTPFNHDYLATYAHYIHGGTSALKDTAGDLQVSLALSSIKTVKKAQPRSKEPQNGESALVRGIVDFLKTPCPFDPKHKSYSHIARRIQGDLAWICSRVILEEHQAVEYLADLGTSIATILEHYRLEQPATFTEVAQKRTTWPVVATCEPDSLKMIKAIREKLKLGKAIQVQPGKIKYVHEDKQQKSIVYHCLRILEVELQIRDQMLKLGACGEVNGIIWTVTGSDAERALSYEVREENEELIKKTRNRQNHSLKALTKLLKLSIASPYMVPPGVATVLEKARKLPILSAEFQHVWFTHIIELLVKLTGNELEENEILRPIGESNGNVFIRDHCKTATDHEFNAMKAALRHDPGLNGAIRTRIKERLGQALKKFL